MGDRRVPLSSALAAFGLPATVTRPAPDDDPISTTGFWVSPLEETVPYGSDLPRRDPRRVFVLPRADVPTINRGTLIEAAEFEGDTVKTWRVDGLDRSVDPDHFRVIVTLVA